MIDQIANTRILFIILLILISLTLKAQQSEKELKEFLKSAEGVEKVVLLNKLSDALLYKSPQQSLQYGEEALVLSRSLNDTKQMGESYLSIAYALRYMGEYYAALDTLYKAINYINDYDDKKLESQILNLSGLINQELGNDSVSLENYFKSFDLAQEINDTYGMLSTLNNLGNFYKKSGNYQKATEYFFKCLKFYEMAKNQKGIAQMYNNIGTVYHIQNNYEKALEYHLKAYEILKTMPNYKTGLAYVYNNLGVIYINLNQYDKAEEFLNQSNEICKELQLHNYLMANYNNLGIIYNEQGHYKKAIHSLLEGLRLADKTKDIPSTTKYLLNIADSYFKQKQYVKSLSYFNRAFHYSKQMNDYFILSENNYGIYEVYKAMGNYNKSLFYLEEYLNYRDSLDVINNAKLVTEIEAQYELEQKEQRIKTLQKTNKIRELELDRKKVNNKILLGGISTLILIISLITFLFIIRIRNNKILKDRNSQIVKQNEELNFINQKLIQSEKELKLSNNTKDKFFSIIAHDLKNPLLGLKSLIFSFNNRGKLKQDEIQMFSNQLNESLNSVIELLNNLLNWAKAQKNELNYVEETVDIYEIISNCAEANEKQLKAKNIKFVNSISSNFKLSTDRNMLDFILRNIIANAIKFTRYGGSIKLKDSLSNTYNIYITDNGVGISKENFEQLFNEDTFFSTLGTNNEEGSGLGLVLCNEFIKKMEGSIKVSSTENYGSTFTIELPLKN